MVLVHLGKHWYARRHYPFVSWAACVARSARVLLFYRDHRGLLGLDVYRRHLTQIHDDVFHHLSHRNYLARGLSLRERVRCVQTHYRFETATFDAAYQQAVYRDGGLVVWQHDADGVRCTIQLEMAERLNAEGDLTLTARLDGIRLHRLSFSWVDSGFAGVPAASTPAVVRTIVPFVARNQGHHAEAAEAFKVFERIFPQNSPSFFCFAALQGIARMLGMEQVVAVKATAQCAYDPARDTQFGNAYDGFWQTLGGTPLAGRGWRIPLPLQLKALAEMSAKHRKRAAQRRAYWADIGDAAGAAVARHLLARP